MEDKVKIGQKIICRVKQDTGIVIGTVINKDPLLIECPHGTNFPRTVTKIIRVLETPRKRYKYFEPRDSIGQTINKVDFNAFLNSEAKITFTNFHENGCLVCYEDLPGGEK